MTAKNITALRDGTVPADRRLDRLVKFDKRSREYPVLTMMDRREPVAKEWACRRWLDQGNEGACVGFGCAHELIAEPVEAHGIDDAYAREQIYWHAQQIDEWPGGSYPGAEPQYEGTSVLSGIKVCKKLGWIDTYRWAFGLQDLILGVGYCGPAVLGLPWYEGMMKTDREGYIHRSGKQSGGHCILCRGVEPERKRFKLRNSWGRNWGMDGDCWISFEDLERLLNERGEAAFFIGRKQAPLGRRP